MNAAFALLLVIFEVASGAGPGAPTVNESTGDLSYRYELALPKARGRHQPALALVYSSAGNQDIGYGHGWVLSTTYVEVDRRAAVDRTLWLVNGSERKLLVPFGAKYRPEVEDTFFEVTSTLAGGVTTYTATDASGSTYSFMRAVGERAYLTKVEDLDGNITEYAYTSQDVEAPDEIRYNNYPPGAVTPNFASKVQLVWENDGSLAPAAVAGMMLDRARRLDRVVALGGAASPQREIRRWEVTYTTAGAAGERSIASITEQAGGLSLPSTTFQYDWTTFALDTPVVVQPPANMTVLPSTFMGGDLGAQWIDLDGDGLTDWIWRYGLTLYWARNVTPIGSMSVQFEPVQAISLSFVPANAVWKLLDFDGDGVTDLVTAWASGTTNYHTIFRGVPGNPFSFSTPGFTMDVSAWVPVASSGAGRFDAAPSRVMTDINGDGVLDYARDESTINCAVDVQAGKLTDGCSWRYALTSLDLASNTATLDEQPDSLQVVPTGQWFPFTDADQNNLYLWLGVDVNGDGLADGVWLTGDKHGGAYNTVDGNWRVILNAGAPASALIRSWGNEAALAGYADHPETAMASFGETTCPTINRDDYRYTIGDLVDFNGDGKPDFVRGGLIGWNTGRRLATQQVGTGGVEYARYDHWSGDYDVYIRPAGYTYDVLCATGTLTSPYKGQFMDFNGDGIPDFLRTLSEVAPAQLEYFRGVNANGIARPVLLREIQIPDGGVYQVDYVGSSVFGAPARSRKPVVTALRTAGQNVSPNATYYWYSGPAKGSLWYNRAKVEDRGFTESWVQDDTTRAVRHTVWSVDSHAYFGRPVTVTTGMPVGRALGTRATLSNPGGPPSTTAISSQNVTYGVKRLGSGAGSGCLTAREPAATDYPLRVVQTRIDAASIYGTTEAVVRNDTACSDVDPDGNVLATTVSESLGGTTGSSLVTRQSFTGSTSCKNVPLELRVTKLAGTVTLAEDVKTFDSSCRLTSEYSPRTGDVSPQTNLKTYSYAGPFHQLDATTVGVTTKRLTYDASSLDVIEERTEDSVTALATTYTYDEATRLVLSVVGPKVVKWNWNAYAGPDPIARYYLYDAFGRKLAVAKTAFTGTGNNPGRVPSTAATANEAVEAYTYLDSWAFRATVSYRFSVARTYALDGPIPETDDVAKAISFRDGLGREIQVRERLGGGGTADPGARVTQTTSGIRVSKVLVYDGAGRVRVSLDPFYDDWGFEALIDYSAGAIPETRGTVTTYDDQPASFSYQRRGQPWCSSYQYIAGALPGIATNCSSDSTHSATFRLATETRYTTRLVPQRGPYAGLFVATEVTPPALGTRVELAGPRGEALGSIDGDGNYTWIERDAMAREIASWREGASRSESTPSPVSTVSYNTAGQVKATWDANYPSVTRTNQYDTDGSLTKVTTDSSTGEGIEYHYNVGDLGRVSDVFEVTYPGGSAEWRIVTRNHYDVPYLNAGTELKYVAGMLAWTENVETTIVYSYDRAGRVERRDQFFAKLDATKRFTMSSSYGDDGRVRDAQVVNPYDAANYFKYTVDYDSNGRPVGINGQFGLNSASERIYETVSQGARGSYDALGRVPTMRADGGRVVSARTYNRYSGALEGECKRFDAGVTCTGAVLDPTKDIYRTDQSVATYVGGRLAGYLDGATQTSYQHAYLPSGRLQSVTAQPSQATPGALAQDWLETFAFNGVGNLGTVTSEQNKYRPSSSSPYRSVTEAYHPASPSSGQVLDRVERIGRTVRDATGAPVNEPGSGTERYAYDQLKHLISVTRSAGESESLTYAPGGELLYRHVGEKFVFYVGEYATVTARGAVGCASTSSCVPQPGTAEVDAHVIFAGTRVASAKPTRTLYYYRTRLGTVIATSLNGGRPGAAYRYTPYGAVEHAVGETDETRSELGYTNALRLSGSLLYLKARVYDTEARVFIQADDVDRLRYAYVQGDPVNASDPTGLLGTREAQTAQVTDKAKVAEDVASSQPPTRANQSDAQDGTTARTKKQAQNGIGLTDEKPQRGSQSDEKAGQDAQRADGRSAYPAIGPRDGSQVNEGRATESGFNVVVGGGGSAVAITGGELSGGVLINPGLGTAKADVGVAGALGPGGGLNVSADVYVGVVFGGADSVSGTTVNQNIVLGPVSVTIIHDPSTGAVLGGTLGLGPSATLFGYSVSYSTTGTATVRNAMRP